MAWEVSPHPEVEAWYLAVCKSDPESADLIEDAIDQLAAEGPALRRPLADRVRGSRYHNMKELRPPSSGKYRDPAAVRVRSPARGDFPGRRGQGRELGWLVPGGDSAGRPAVRPAPGRSGSRGDGEAMSDSYAKWSDVRARGREADPRTAGEQAAGKAAAGERREAYVRGHQLAEMRTAAGVTQAALATALGVSQARVSKIEHGEISGIDVVRAYVTALGGSIDVVATLGDRSWKVT